MSGMTRYEQQFYEQFAKFQEDVRRGVELKKKELETLELQNEILVAIYRKLDMGTKKPEEEQKPGAPALTGNAQIDALLAKQRAKL